MADLAEEPTLRRPYRKWGGAHWRLVSLVELGVQPGDGPATTVCERVLDYWAGQRRLTSVPVVEGRARRCASQEGNAVAVATRTRGADPPVVRRAALPAVLALRRSPGTARPAPRRLRRRPADRPGTGMRCGQAEARRRLARRAPMVASAGLEGGRRSGGLGRCRASDGHCECTTCARRLSCRDQCWAS